VANKSIRIKALTILALVARRSTFITCLLSYAFSMILFVRVFRNMRLEAKFNDR
jgi:hypothetical protein